MTTMLTPRSSALDQLIAAIREEVARGRDWPETVARVATGLGAHLPDLAGAEWAGSAERAAGHRLHVEADGSFSLLAIVWRQHQWTRIHDHMTWCAFGTLRGEVVEDLYRLEDDSETLVAAGRRDCPAGTISADAPPGDIHRLGNPHAQTATTLHVYGTDVTRLGTSARRTYDPPIAR